MTQTHRNRASWLAGTGLQVVLSMVGFAGATLQIGCARLETVAPRDVEMQVTVDSLKTAVRDAQRTAAELRTELEEQRKELADAQLARAQLQGMLRETERRLADARQIIELQREELASARVERERVAQASRLLNGRLRQLQHAMLQRGRKVPALSDGVAAASVMGRDTAEVVPLPVGRDVEKPARGRDQAPEIATEESTEAKDDGGLDAAAVPRTIVVSEGETLWRLARRHKVDLEELRALNGLPNYTIIAGHTLRLPAPRVAQVAPDPAFSASAAR